MTLDDVLASLFPSGHQVERGPSGTLHGTAKVDGQGDVTVVGIVDGTPLSVDGAILLAGHVLAAVEAGDRAPIVFSSIRRARTWRVATSCWDSTNISPISPRVSRSRRRTAIAP